VERAEPACCDAHAKGGGGAVEKAGYELSGGPPLRMACVWSEAWQASRGGARWADGECMHGCTGGAMSERGCTRRAQRDVWSHGPAAATATLASQVRVSRRGHVGLVATCGAAGNQLATEACPRR